MPYVIGIVLSAGVAVFARYVGFDRDRAFYPTVMIVIASYYVLFAAMSGSVQTVVIESVVMTLFAAAAVAGFKSSAWIVIGALAGHGVVRRRPDRVPQSIPHDHALTSSATSPCRRSQPRPAAAPTSYAKHQAGHQAGIPAFSIT